VITGENEVNRTSIRRSASFAAALVLGLSLAACGDDDNSGAGSDGDESVSGSVTVDGSSTVFPMSQAAEELLSEENPNIQVAVGESGTGGGVEKFCAGQTDVSDASRPIDEEEVATCEAGSITYTELQVATDALTVVVNPELDVDCLTVDQLKELWGPESTVTKWNQLDPSFPDEDIELFGPGTDSGTYDYMANDVIESETEATRSDYEASEDDNVLVQGVANTPGATAYFGYTYYEQNSDSLKAVAIDSGGGCVEPSAETAGAGEYTPLARPLFIYVNNAKYNDNAAAKAYVDYYIDNLSEIAEIGQFIPLSDEQYAETQAALEGIAAS